MKKLILALLCVLTACSGSDKPAQANSISTLTVKVHCTNPYTDNVIFERTIEGVNVLNPTVYDQYIRVYLSDASFSNYVDIIRPAICVIESRKYEQKQ
jgi:hypothetical protein